MLVEQIVTPEPRPIEAKVIFNEMLTEEMLFQVQYLREIVATQLDRGFADLLPRWRNLMTFFQKQNAL